MPANVRSRLPAIPSPIEGRTIKALINHTAVAKRTPRSQLGAHPRLQHESVEESHRKPDHEVEAGLEYRACWSGEGAARQHRQEAEQATIARVQRYEPGRIQS